MTEEGDIPEDDDILAAEYALGLHRPDERAGLESRLERDGGFRARVAFWQEHLASLVETVPETAPPAAVWRRIEAQLPAPRRAAAPPRRSSPWRILTALASATALALAAVLLVEPEAPAAPIYAGEIRAEDGSLRVAAAYDAETGTLRLARAEGSAPAGRVLQLWAAVEGNVYSLGVLPDDPRASVELPQDVRAGIDGAILEISEEPPGGSPTDLPTGEVLAIGGVTRL